MLKNKNVLITGATSGIGEALALYYAEKKAKNLFICGRNSDRLLMVTQKCQQLGCAVFSKVVDVTNREETRQWIVECEKTASLNLVIANAGIATLEENTDNIYNTFNTNVNGVLNTILPTIEIYKNRTPKALDDSDSSLNRFIKNKRLSGQAFTLNPFHKKHLKDIGCEFFNIDDKAIAIISSIAGYHGLPSCPSYSASKACVKAWGEGLRGSLKKDKINVSVICPGFVRSRITDKNTCKMPFFWEADKAAKVIVRRLEKNVGLIAFPWPLRFASWLLSILPNRISQKLYDRLPHKV